MKDSALVVVDMLYDFIDGSMECKNSANAVNEAVKFIEEKFSEVSDSDEDIIQASFPVLFVCDHHPQKHCSFVNYGGTWPEHCVQGTRGAEIHDSLKPYANEEFIFYKGYEADKEQYSGAQGINDAGQSLIEVLEIMDIKNVYLCGIATEYCVNDTCNDLRKAGFKIHILKKALGYVDENGHNQTIEKMQKDGIKFV